MAQKPSYEEFERISKERHDLELIYNSVTNPVMVLGPDQNILSVNLATERLIGISKSELLNKKCYDVMHSENCVTQSGCCPFQKVFSGEVANNIEAEIELKNESFLVICTPVFDKNGQLDKVFHVSTNVTLLKKNEKKALMLLEATRTIPLSKGFTEAAKSIYDICKDHIGATSVSNTHLTLPTKA